jgi:anti-sigma B factor antagonist
VTAKNGMMKLCCICPNIHEVFAVTKLDGLFDVEEDEAAALAAFGIATEVSKCETSAAG